MILTSIELLFCCGCWSTLVAMATYSFHWLTMGKVKIKFYCHLIADILTKVLQKCLLSCSPPAYHFRLNLSIWLVTMATQRLNCKKILINLLLRSYKGGINLNLLRIVHNISLNKITVFYCRCWSTLVAMATYSFHWFTMGKVKIEIYCYLIADIVTKVLQKCLLSGSPPAYFNPNLAIWLVAMGSERLNCKRNIKKSTPQKLQRGDKAEPFKNCSYC